MRKMFVFIALVCLFITACGASPEDVEAVVCNQAVFNEAVESLLEEWEGVIQVSLQRFPGALAPQISDMERILGEYQNIKLPDCYQPVYEKVLEGLQFDLEGVKEFDLTGDTSDKFELADEAFAEAQTLLQNLGE